MALTNVEIEANREEYLQLIKSIKREGANIEKLVEKLNNSDFFLAPASTKFHCDYDGGLCQHSLNVYYNLLNIIQNKQGLDVSCYDEDSIKIVALLHDISKMNRYEKVPKNVKVYCADGKLYDEHGHYKWETQMNWATRKQKFVYGSHEMTSEYIARQFIPLTLDESVAILHHMGSMAWDSAKDNIGEIFTQYPLALILYMADMISSYIDEKQINE